jgi:hypothetical protein
MMAVQSGSPDTERSAGASTVEAWHPCVACRKRIRPFPLRASSSACIPTSAVTPGYVASIRTRADRLPFTRVRRRRLCGWHSTDPSRSRMFPLLPPEGRCGRVIGICLQGYGPWPAGADTLGRCLPVRDWRLCQPSCRSGACTASPLAVTAARSRTMARLRPGRGGAGHQRRQLAGSAG